MNVNDANPTARRLPISQGGPAAAVAFALGVVGLMALLRLVVMPTAVLPIGYGVPLVLFVFLGNRKLLWASAAAFAVISFFEILIVQYAAAGRPVGTVTLVDIRDYLLVLLDLAVVAAAVHVLIGYQQELRARHADLVAANADLSGREEEIARQNEELQSQTEELERQSEELRLANEELARRERTLENLLDLSRGLTIDLSRPETLRRICEALGTLVNGPSVATGIVERRGGELVVTCHSGFGEAGIECDRLPVDRSFAELIFSHGRTGYIEDLSLRPELVIAQPAAPGRRHVSVLSTPLRVAGQVIGALEVYGTEKRGWSAEQINLIESLAAQASISLEAAHLYEQVAQERRKLEAVFRALPIGVAIVNRDYTDLRVNPAAAAMMRVPVDANLAEYATAGRRWEVYVDGALVPASKSILRRAVAENRELANEEMDVVLAGGRRLSVLASAAPIRDAGGAAVGGVAAFVDVSRLKELEREIDARRREAEESSVRKTRFLAAVSHDVRTPANAITLLAELMRRTSSNPAMYHEIPDLARELHASALALVDLLGDVLDVTRFDSGRIELVETDFDLGELLESECRRLSPLARDKRLDFTCGRDDPDPHAARPLWVRADKIKVARVVGNLLGNAIKFTDAGGQVRLTYGRATDGGGVTIAVRDTGVGIADADVKYIFDEFFQLRNPERDRNKGNGLGLTICKRLTDAMGGRLTVDSAPGRGSTFTIVLPAGVVVPAPQV